MSFGETLKSLREAAGLTQAQLADGANVPLDTLRRWEQGKHLPQIDAAYRLAKAMGIGINDLVLPKDMIPDEAKPKQPRGRPRKAE
jgi:transcriptional regulator with XRE-family HTH domain